MLAANMTCELLLKHHFQMDCQIKDTIPHVSIVVAKTSTLTCKYGDRDLGFFSLRRGM